MNFTSELLDAMSRKCVLMEKTTISDGAGGGYVAWKEGIQFTNYIATDSSMEARIAQQQGVTSVYSALVLKTLPIEYNDTFKDLKTGRTYRVTSDPKDKEAPGFSALGDMKYFTAEKYTLPDYNAPGKQGEA